MSDAAEREVYLVESGGESIYAEATGEGTPVVLCHGLGGNHAIWWQQINSLASQHRVVTWDQRGFGNSTASTSNVSIKAAASDLHAILDQLDLQSACIIGQSMGAFTALRAALDGPGRIGSVVVSTSLSASDPAHTRALTAVAGSKFGRNQHPVVSAEFSGTSPDLGVLYNLISSFGAKPTSMQMLEHMADETFTDEELKSIKVPVAFIASENDVFCPPPVMEAARSRFPADTTFDVIPGVGHSAYFESPVAWNECVLAVIQRLTANTSPEAARA